MADEDMKNFKELSISTAEDKKNLDEWLGIRLKQQFKTPLTDAEQQFIKDIERGKIIIPYEFFN